MTKRPYTDVQDLVDAATDQAVDERILPAVERLDKATKVLNNVTPLLQDMCKRQNTHMIWLFSLSAAVVSLYILILR